MRSSAGKANAQSLHRRYLGSGVRSLGKKMRVAQLSPIQSRPAPHSAEAAPSIFLSASMILDKRVAPRFARPNGA
jgi:hypothetical protein